MIQKETELYELMAEKLEILQNISTNTSAQLRFIQQRKLKGLHRLLDERAQYLQDLALLNDKLNRIADNDIGKLTMGEQFKQMEIAIQVKESEIICANDEALKAANAERDHIISDLHNVRIQKNLKHCYNYRWIKRAGNKLILKG
ncbi:MAG TPA: hypothetical protein VN426_15225 [Syntrophomonadaceae bacterium]|nr:hypothetical protein [Syntrophomonadaceae bacterium]